MFGTIELTHSQLSTFKVSISHHRPPCNNKIDVSIIK